MHTRASLLICITAVLAGLAATASAAVITVSPLHANPGETITVNVQGLSDESLLQMNWEVYIDQPGPEFLWSVEGLSFPINLQNASFRITNQNTATNKVTLQNDVPNYESRELILSGTSVDGVWTAYHGSDFINGTWPVIRNEGTVEEGKTSVLSLVEWQGIKRANPEIPEQQNGGPQDFAIPFSFSGFENGRVKFTIRVNGTDVLTDTVTVGSPVSRTGTLYVYSSPSAAMVYIDGVYYGLTPRKVGGIPLGTRTVKITKEGYADSVNRVQVISSGITPVMVTLSPAFASIIVSTIPPGADVSLDSLLVGTTPMTITGVSPGTHVLTLTREGYQDYHATLVIARGETVRLTNIFLFPSSLAASGRFWYTNITSGGPTFHLDKSAFTARVNAQFPKFQRP